ncbi:MAG: molybdopterin oxidoreductase family protein, partial [Cyclobacteriaceae bacterium]|nr:molybdopterin oxidoreductase family protein [Cyclobacteriaceae bacterium]
AHGKNSIGIYQGNPSVHNYGTALFSPGFVRALGTKNRFSATSVDQLPHHLAAQFMFGHPLLIPIPDIDRTDFFLVIGANPFASNGSLMTAAGMPKRIKALQQRGGEVVVIDPRKTETAEKADQHLFIKPGTDILFLLGMIHVLFREKLIDEQSIRHSKGVEKIQAKVKDLSLDLIARHTGIASEDLINLTRRFATANTAVCYGRMGVSVQRFGSLCQYLINVINILTQNFDRAGGAMFTTPAVDIVAQSGKSRPRFGRWKSRVSGLPEFGGELPVSVLADEILTPGNGQIKAFITSAGNPILSTPNGARLEEALTTLDYMVSIDIYINETTKHANIILPPVTGLESDHYDLVFHLLAVRNTAKYSPALFTPDPGAKYDWEIYKALTSRLSTDKNWFSKLLLNWKTPKRLLDAGLRTGPYGFLKSSLFNGLNLKKLMRFPHGVDFGPLKTRLPQRLCTNDHKIDLAPDIFIGSIDECIKSFKDDKANGFDLQLIGRRHLRSNNSWMHNSHRLTKGPVRCTLLMHPEDAAARSFKNEEVVNVTSKVGAVQLPVEISNEIMPGVVSIPHGWGHHRKGTRQKNAEENAGVSINDLTDHTQLDTLSGNSAFSNNRVNVKAV